MSLYKKVTLTLGEHANSTEKGHLTDLQLSWTRPWDLFELCRPSSKMY